MIDSRPTDRRENYVKRCVGMPGQMLQIKNKIVYLDGKPNKEPENVQYTYLIKWRGVTASELLGQRYDDLRKELNISEEDVQSLSYLHGADVERGTILHASRHRPRRLLRHGLSARRLHTVDARQLWSGMDSEEGREHQADPRQPAGL